MFKSPKSKKHATKKKYLGLPLNSTVPNVGVFNGLLVIVFNWDSMNKIHGGGCFGKGSLSKGEPLHHFKKDDIPRMISKKQYNKMLKWNNKVYYNSPEKYSGVLKNDFQLSISSVDNLLKFSFLNNHQDYGKFRRKFSEENLDGRKCLGVSNVQSLLDFSPGVENYSDPEFCQKVEQILLSQEGIKNKDFHKSLEDVIVVTSDLKALDSSLDHFDVAIEKLSYLGEENLYLSLEESFFLKFATNTLNILDLNLTTLSLPTLWKRFTSLHEKFFVKYIIYHYYRTKGWVIKSGLKFGGQYLLYKQGPAYYHSTYLIQVLDKRKKLKWKDFVGMNRLVETYNKDLILCDVHSSNPLSDEQSFPKGLRNFKVQEVLTRRWFPSKERFSSSNELEK